MQWARYYASTAQLMIAMDFDSHHIVRITYRNYRGETSTRNIVPKRIRFASSEWHPTSQWLLDAFDIDRRAERAFAMKDIQSWEAD